MKVPGGRSSERANNISEEIRKFYLGTRPVSEETLEEMIYVNIEYKTTKCQSYCTHLFYYNNPITNYNFLNIPYFSILKLLTDIMFIKGISDSARLHATTSSNSTFVYRFGFDGTLGLYKRLLGIQRPGTCHGDELGYLFHFGVFNLSLDPASQEIQVKRRMVKMWTNFAKYG